MIHDGKYFQLAITLSDSDLDVIARRATLHSNRHYIEIKGPFNREKAEQAVADGYPVIVVDDIGFTREARP